MRKEGLAAVVAVLVVAGLGAGYLTVSGTGNAASQSSGVVNETIFIHVVNSTSGEPIPNEPLTAGPASSPSDLYFPSIDSQPTTNECVHGAVSASNGTTTVHNVSQAACPLKDYDTNGTGWVVISNQDATYFFIEAGMSTGPNAFTNTQIIALEGSQTYVTVPFPAGNFTVSSTG
jgi:hypothetical protein